MFFEKNFPVRDAKVGSRFFPGALVFSRLWKSVFVKNESDCSLRVTDQLKVTNYSHSLRKHSNILTRQRARQNTAQLVKIYSDTKHQNIWQDICFRVERRLTSCYDTLRPCPHYFYVHIYPSRNRRNLKAPAVRFSVDQKNILKTVLFETDNVAAISMWFPWPSFPQTNPKWPVIEWNASEILTCMLLYSSRFIVFIGIFRQKWKAQRNAG